MSCAVKSCRNYKSRRPEGISFYVFPRDKKMLNKWIETLGLGSNWTRTINKFVCSKHFCAEDFNAHHGERGRRGLKPTAVPSLLLDEHLNSTVKNDSQEYIFQIPVNPDGSSSELIDISMADDSSSSFYYTTYSIPKQQRTSKDDEVYMTISPDLHNFGMDIDTSANQRNCIDTERVRKRKTIKLLKCQDYRRKLHKANRRIRALKKDVVCLRTVVNLLKRKHRLSKKASKNIKKTYRRIPSRKAKKYLKSRRNSAIPTIQNFAAALQVYSPKAYKYVRSKFTLRSPNIQEKKD